MHPSYHIIERYASVPMILLTAPLTYYPLIIVVVNHHVAACV